MPLKKLNTVAKNIRLSHNEKAVMRARLEQAMDTSLRVNVARVRTQSSYSWFSIRFAMPLAAFLIIVLGGSTVYAAQTALPGGPLYPVKIYVNEQVEGALAISPEAKVSFHTGVAETRLKEAEALASEGRLDANTSAQIESNFNDHVAEADTIAKGLEDEDPAASVEATVRLDSSLAAHGSILGRIGQGSLDEATKNNAIHLAIQVRSREGRGDGSGDTVATTMAAMAPQVQTTSLETTGAASSSGVSDTSQGDHARFAPAKGASKFGSTATATSTQKKIALQLQRNASSELNDTQDQFDSLKKFLAATTSAKIEAQLQALGTRMDDGDAQIKSKDYTSARTTFTNILHDTVELSAFIDASKTFKRDFIRTFWSIRGNDNTDEGIQGSTNDSSHGSVDTKDTHSGKDSGGESDGENSSSAGVHVEVHL